MKEFIHTEARAETAVLVALITKTQDERKTNEYLDELEFLAETAGAQTVRRFTQRIDGPSSVTYVGKGKLEEIRQYIEECEQAADEAEKDLLWPADEEKPQPVGMVIFDDELSAKQLRNIEAALQVKILDRTSLILDIFAMRAQTANAKTQVELAQYRYMLPRLQRLWTHLERQGGGSGGAGGGKGGSVGLRGPGETQLEMDRRIILNRMSLLKERLAEIDKQKRTQRQNRGKMVRVALVGYTNVGKSTLLNLLSKSDVFAENKLFATLDTTVRKVVVSNLPFLLADTVGFIRKLPTDLVESFKSTLEPGFRRTNRSGEPHALRLGLCRQTTDFDLQQDGRLHFHAERSERSHPGGEREHAVDGTHANVDGTRRWHRRSPPSGRRRGVGRDFHFCAPKAEHRRTARTALHAGARTPCAEIPVQRFPLSGIFARRRTGVKTETVVDFPQGKENTPLLDKNAGRIARFAPRFLFRLRVADRPLR